MSLFPLGRKIIQVARRTFIAGRYEILDSLGQGGGGKVFLVHDTMQGNRRVALKTVGIPRKGFSPLLADLKNEFTTLSLLRHPNLARVFDFGTTKTEMYFTSEWVDGKNLAQATEHSDFNAVFAVLAQVLRAVDYIHKRGVLHLDLKPANILVTEHDVGGELTARVIDFGIAKWKRGRRLKSAHFFGTPPFAAPEIILSREPTSASDIYSLGMIFHLVFAKRFPFPANKAFEILRWQTIRDPDYLPNIHPALPEEFSKLLHAMVSRDPSARPQSAGEVLERLSRCLGESFPLRDATAPADILGESDFFFHADLIASLAERLRKRKPKVIALVGPPGSGKSRLLFRLKADLQLQEIRSFYFKESAAVEDILAQKNFRKCPVLLDDERGLTDALRKKLAQSKFSYPLIVAIKSNDEAATLGAEILRVPSLNSKSIHRFFESEIRGIPEDLSRNFLEKLDEAYPSRFAEFLQGLREAGLLLWSTDGWVWKGKVGTDLREIMPRHAQLWEERKRSIRLLLEEAKLSLPAASLAGLVGLAPGSLEEKLEIWCGEGWMSAHWEKGLRCFQATHPGGNANHESHGEDDDARLAQHLQSLYEEGKYSEGVALADALERANPRQLQPSVCLLTARHLVAEGYLQRALDWLPTQPLADPLERGLLWEIRGRVFHRQGRTAEAREALRESEREFSSVRNDPGMARVFNLRGTLSKEEAKFEEAERYFFTAVSSALQAGDHYLAGTAQTNLALSYQEQGEINQALHAYARAWEFCRISCHPKLANVLFHNWINLQHHMGRSVEAEKSCYEWLNMAIQNRYAEQEASALNYLALFAGQKRLLGLQASFLDQAISLVNPEQSPRLFAQFCANRALLQWSLKNYSSAQQDGETALKLCRSRPDDPLLAWIYLVLGKVARDRPSPDYSEASRYFEASEKNVEKNHTRQLLWEVEYNQGKLHKKIGDIPKAKRFFQAAQGALLDLEKNLPTEFKESYLRDRKSDRIAWELENLESEKNPEEFPDSLSLRTGLP